jgi:hypothetical protein
MKILLTFFCLLMLSAITVFAQKTTSVCTNKVGENFSSRGIKLGMKTEDVLSNFEEENKLTFLRFSYLADFQITGKSFETIETQNILQTLEKKAKANFGRAFLASIAPKDQIRFDGISRYDFGFIDGQLVFLRVYYLKPKWESREQFVNYLTKNLDFPEYKYWESSLEIKCGDYKLTVSNPGYLGNDEAFSSLEISKGFNETIRERQIKAQNEERERDIKAFKP